MFDAVNNGIKNRYRFLHDSKWSRSDKLAKWNLIASLLVGGAAIILSIAALYQSHEIAQDKQRIQGFDTLLMNTDSVIQRLNEQVAIMNKNENEKTKINERKFTSSVVALNKVFSDIPIIPIRKFNMKQREVFLNSMRPVLEDALNNPFLLSQDTLFLKWRKATYLLTDYQQTQSRILNVRKEMFIKKDLDKYWVAVFDSVAALSDYSTAYVNNHRLP